jgi:glycosyltransferase involved in cell wall biosynthesis
MQSDSSPLSVALAHHWLISMRGGEKTLAALAEMYPQAPIFTLLARHKNLEPPLTERRIHTSLLQHLLAVPDLQRKILPLMPTASKHLDARRFDAVICSDAALIKAIRTRPDALKICYCHSPIRYLWDLYDEYYARSGLLNRLGLRVFAPSVRRADRKAAETVTAFIANSRHVAERIRRHYQQPSVVIPPPVDTDWPPPQSPEDFYLVVGEHVPYKRNDLAIDACNRLGRKLVVIGTGPQLQHMRKIAGPTVKVLGYQPADVVRDYMRRCKALLFCGEEDFGLVPVEVQAAGRPVIAYAAGGALETVLADKTGLFFPQQTPHALAAAIEKFERISTLYSPEQIQQHATQFSKTCFQQHMRNFMSWCFDHYRQGGPGKVRQAMGEISPEYFVES